MVGTGDGRTHLGIATNTSRYVHDRTNVFDSCSKSPSSPAIYNPL
jgi:hypothetical protein